MPTTYSPSLRLALLGNGEDSGTWGQLTNTNLGTLLEQAITGVTTISMTGGPVTLTSYNGVSDLSRNAVIVLTGTQTAIYEVTVPDVQKTYLVNNTCSFPVDIKVSGGGTYRCAVGTVSNVYCTGAGGIAGASTLVSTPTYQSFTNPLIVGIRETITIGSGAGGATNFDTLNQAIIYGASNATSNFTVNFRGNSTTTLNSLMAIGQSFSATLMATQGSTAYYNTGVSVDGTAVTPKWQNGTAPSSGNINSVDLYTYVIIKTANATFSIFASQTKFA